MFVYPQVRITEAEVTLTHTVSFHISQCQSSLKESDCLKISFYSVQLAYKGSFYCVTSVAPFVFPHLCCSPSSSIYCMPSAVLLSISSSQLSACFLSRFIILSYLLPLGPLGFLLLVSAWLITLWQCSVFKSDHVLLSVLWQNRSARSPFSHVVLAYIIQ